MRKTEIIQRLNELDLHNCKDNEILNLIDHNRYPIQLMDIKPGQVFFRATVLSEPETIECVTLKRLTYLQADKSKHYQRASIPGHTMFYGIMPNIEDKSFCESGIAAAFFETSRFFRDKTRKTKWNVHIVSKWVNKEPITLFVIADPFLSNKSYRLNDCSIGYRAFVQGMYSPEQAEDELLFQEYIFKQFSTPFDDECKYRISALFANKFLEEAKKQGKKIDGFIWQSAINIDDKLNDSLCVAILPEIIDNFFQAPDSFHYMREFNNGGFNKLEKKELVKSKDE